MKFTVAVFFVVFGIANSEVIQLTSGNWGETLQGEWIIKFYAPWCPACRAINEEYKQFSDFASTLGVKVGEVDITTEPGLSGRFLVTALPTIYHSVNGEFRQYTGKRSADHWQDFIEKKMWKDEEPVSSYRHPNSIFMSLMAGLFQMSIWMKNFLDLLTENYGFSALTAYIIFGITVVAVGLILGVILILIIDCINPPKNMYNTKPNVVRKEEMPVVDKKSSHTPASESHGEEEVAAAGDAIDEKEESQDELHSQSNRSSKSSSQSEFETISPEEIEDAGDVGTSATVRLRKTIPATQ